MKLEKRITIPIHDTLEKFIILSIVFCLISFALPMHSKAENEPLPEPNGIPSYNGSLSLSPQDEAAIKQENKAEKTVSQKQKKDDREIRLNKYPASTIQTTEDGSNLIVIQGSRYPEIQNNSVNHNNGFYMNITNPDGSAMSFGSYFNSNSSSQGGRRQSRSQIIVE